MTNELSGYDPRVKTETVHRMDYGDVGDLLNEHFPQLKGEYDFAAAEETGNDEARSFSVSDKPAEPGSMEADYDLPDIESGNWQYRTNIYLDELARRGVIPAGSYVVDISW